MFGRFGDPREWGRDGVMEDWKREIASNPPPLHTAARSGNTNALRTLLGNGAYINELDSGFKRKTPLHYASDHNSISATELLLGYGADVNAQDFSNYTPLHNAAKHNSPDTAKLLLEYGADVNSQTSTNITPLHNAAKHNSPDTAKLLLEYGANPTTNDLVCAIPLHYAISNLHNPRPITILLLLHTPQSSLNPKIASSVHTNGYSKLAHVYLALNGDNNIKIELGNKSELLSIVSDIFDAASPSDLTNSLIANKSQQPRQRVILPLMATALSEYTTRVEKPLNIENLKEFCMGKWMNMLERNPNITLHSL